MTDSSNNDHSILNLSPEEKRVFTYLFNQADKDQLGVVTGENAVTFFERTKLSPNLLGEIWQIADTENRGLLTQPGFFMVLRLIGHWQAGKEPTTELAFKQGPIPRFDGIQIPSAAATGSGVPSPTGGGFPPTALQPQLSGQAPIAVPRLDPQKVQQYSGLFERSGTQGGQIDGATAKAIFERAGLPNEVLGRIWSLTDRTQKGSLDQTEFIVAMHLLTSIKSKAMSGVPTTLPPGLYEAAARRGAPPSRQGSTPGVIPRQTTGSSFGAIPRTQSPLARPPGFGTPPPVQSAQTTGTQWLVTPIDKSKYDQFFQSIDRQGRGIISGEQAVTFFSDSRLPEESLAQIWDLADINSEGQLNRDEFAVAMYLIRQQRGPNPPPLPAFLPPALIPPSMRKQQQQTQSTAPTFDNANNTSGLSKSAADDLFGLDQPASPPRPQQTTAVLQPQGTGASVSRDPFGGSQPGSPSPSSPQRFQSAPQQASTIFKPFIPTSSFGASLASQNTGSSGTGPSVIRAAAPPPSSAMDDLLGDNETHAEESSRLTSETTELANMSNQIGNLRTQMETTQAKKSTTQADLNATSAQKRDLEVRLQQFRSQYEQEVRTVKDLEQQLAASRESTKKLGQEIAMLEGTHQDLQTQHQSVSQALQADQQENASLKQRIAQVNTEVARLKPDIEKLKLDARQQKGMVSINKKQLATNEAERDRLQTERTTLEREASEREEQERAAIAAAATAATTAVAAAPIAERVVPPVSTTNVSSPTASLSSTNPFMRKPSSEGQVDRSVGSGGGPTPSAFDAIFGPSSSFSPGGQASSGTGTPPATSFVARSIPAASTSAVSDSVQSISSTGQPTPSITPPVSDSVKETPRTAEPPPPPASRQFSASHLPVVDVDQKVHDSETSSTRVVPPASRAGDAGLSRTDTPTPAGTNSMHIPGSFDDVPTPSPAVAALDSSVPGAFPDEPSHENSADVREAVATQSNANAKAGDEFESAFAGFGEDQRSADAVNNDPFAGYTSQAQASQQPGFNSEFPPIQNLEFEGEDSSDDESDHGGFDDNFTVASPPRHDMSHSQQEGPATTSATTALSGASATTIPLERTASDLPSITAQKSPPTYEESNEPSHGGSGERTGSNQFPPEFGGLLPSREDPTSPPHPAGHPPSHSSTETSNLPQSTSANAPFTSTTPTDVFHDAPSQQTTFPLREQPQASTRNAFDDFDEFDDLAEAREADNAGSNDTDFGFGGHSVEEFNPAFDSPAASMTNTVTSSQQTPVVGSRSLHQSENSNGFANFQSSHAGNAFGSTSEPTSTQETGQNAQHDWDAIFSGLDNSNVDTSLSSSGDPWTTNGADKTPTTLSPQMAAPTSTRPNLGRAITPGTEHDDPILKRLTSMGYPRQAALTALEKYDYDINKAVDHLSGS